MHLTFQPLSKKSNRLQLAIGSVILAIVFSIAVMLSMAVSSANAYSPGMQDPSVNAEAAAIVNRPPMWSSGIEFLSAGRYHTCYLNTTDEFICWGDSAAYPNSGSPDFTPMWITDTSKISTGDYSTCALKNDGSIQCWSLDSNLVNSVITGTQFSDLSVGTSHACAIDANEDIRCWGDLSNGLEALITGTFSLVSSGKQNDCALDNGQVQCWGANSWGVNPPNSNYSTLSVGQNHACGIRNGTINCWGNTSLTPPGGTNFIEIESGSDYSCAWDNSSHLTCWGTNPNLPVVDTQSTYSMFSSGFLHTCALRPKSPSGSYLACWGANSFGQAPRLTLTPTSLPSYLPLDRPFSQSFQAAGGRPTYTLSIQGGIPGLSLNGWTLAGIPTASGSHNFSLTAYENFAASNLPLELTPKTIAYSTQVEDASTSITISTNVTQTLTGSPIQVEVVISDAGTPTLAGSVTITGTNTISGILENSCTTTVVANHAECTLSFLSAGTKTFTASYNGDNFYFPSQPVTTTVAIDQAPINASLSAGTNFTCANDSSGKLTCWGMDDSGQASPPSGVFNVISAGDAHACGRSLNGAVNCWGWDGWGVASPPTEYTFSSVTSGIVHSCGLHYDGSVSCWGNPADGRTSPPITAFSLISAGDTHTCGLDYSGQAICWGDNTHGESTPTPTGTQYSSISSGGNYTCGIRSDNGALNCWGSFPTPVPSGNFVSVESGRNHACAINSSGSLVCWGSNSNGQTTVPVQSQTFSTVSAGATHTCALTSDNSLLCWGSNNHGQAPTITISPATLPDTIDVNVGASYTITASGGREPQYSYSIIYQDPVANTIHLDTNTGSLNYTPQQAGYFTYTLQAKERNFTPAVKQEITYNQFIRSEVDVQIANTDPITGMVGQPVEVFVQVDESPGDFIAVSPSLTVTIEADDSSGCTFQLDNGSGSCFVFITSPGIKQIHAIYSGDGYFKPGQTAVAIPITIEPFSQTTRITTSKDATLIHLPDGSVRCFGDACQDISLNDKYPMVSAGETQVCAIQTDGQAICQPLGMSLASTEIHSGPFIDLSVGKDHVCAIGPNGDLSCWGDNSSGQATPPAGSFVAVSSGDAHTCAIHSDGTLECWGDVPHANDPNPGTAYKTLQTSTGHTCALRSDNGQIDCWGDNTYGQIDAPSGQFLSVGVGDKHSCGLRTDMWIACWGDDSDMRSAIPYGTFAVMASAVDHNCALETGPKLTCWGKNDQGEAPAISVVPLGGVEAQVVIPALSFWEHGFYPQGGLKPFKASLASGILPPGTTVGIQLSPAGTVLYGIPQVPGIYPFVLRWEDSASIPLAVEHPYTITVTGVDLEVTVIPDHPTMALSMNEFGYQIVLANLTSLPAKDIMLTITLPDGLSSVQSSGMSNCVTIQDRLQCTLSSMPANSSQTLSIIGLVTTSVGNHLTLTAQASALNPDWPEVAPNNNQAHSTVDVAMSYTYFEDTFEGDPPALVWSGGSVFTAPSGITYLDDFTESDSLHLVLEDLPAHQSVYVSFDLFVIGPWEGNAATPPGWWGFGQDGLTPVISTTFSNLPNENQAFPSDWPDGDHPWRTGAAGTDELGYTNPTDTRYNLAFHMIHSEKDLDLLFQSLNLPAGARWGIDNFQVVLNGNKYTIFLPVITK